MESETDSVDSRIAKVAAIEMPEGGTLYDRITQRVIAALEAGTTPWARPWATKDAGPNNIVTGHYYRGINVLMLWMTAATSGYRSDRWITARWLFNEGKERGMKLKRLPGFEEGMRSGQRTATVIYWGRRKPGANDTVNDAEAEKDRFQGVFAKSYGVFNLDQVEGVPDEWIDEAIEVGSPPMTSAAERFTANLNARIDVGGNYACYSPKLDRIRMPAYGRFLEKQAAGVEAETHYWGTLFHELTHWTGHASRLNREGIVGERNKRAYAYEELIAEMGSAFASARFGYDAIQAHASYVDHWITALKRDNRLIVRAAAAAQRAVEFMDSLQPKEPA